MGGGVSVEFVTTNEERGAVQSVLEDPENLHVTLYLLQRRQRMQTKM